MLDIGFFCGGEGGGYSFFLCSYGFFQLPTWTSSSLPYYMYKGYVRHSMQSSTFSHAFVIMYKIYLCAVTYANHIWGGFFSLLW